MSGNVSARAAQGRDRRRARTRQALLRAFVALLFERRYDMIGVADIVARGDVGRSTYYEHFGSKEALLRESMAPMLGVIADAGTGAIGDPAALNGVVDHLWENRRLGRTVFAAPLRALVERQLAELIEARLPRGGRLVAMQIAAAQLSAIDAWVTGVMPATAAEIAAAVTAPARLAG